MQSIMNKSVQGRACGMGRQMSGASTSARVASRTMLRATATVDAKPKGACMRMVVQSMLP